MAPSQKQKKYNFFRGLIKKKSPKNSLGGEPQCGIKYRLYTDIKDEHHLSHVKNGVVGLLLEHFIFVSNLGSNRLKATSVIRMIFNSLEIILMDLLR